MTRPLSLLVLVLAVGVASIWASEIRLPGGYLPSPIIVTNEVEQNILIMPITGSVSEPITEPGWEFAWPMSRVITLDRRLQHLNAVPVDVVIAGGQTLKTDYYVVWRIVGPNSFIETFPQFLEDEAFGRIEQALSGIGAGAAVLCLRRHKGELAARRWGRKG